MELYIIKIIIMEMTKNIWYINKLSLICMKIALMCILVMLICMTNKLMFISVMLICISVMLMHISVLAFLWYIWSITNESIIGPNEILNLKCIRKIAFYDISKSLFINILNLPANILCLNPLTKHSNTFQNNKWRIKQVNFEIRLLDCFNFWSN